MLFVSFDSSGVIAALDGLKEGTPRAIVRALNRAIGGARTTMVKSIASDTGMKSGDVRAALPMTTATVGRPQASLAASMKRIPLMEFKAQSSKKGGVSYQLQGGKNNVPNAFIAMMGSGHIGVFARAGKPRLPIRELFGPSLGHVFIKYRPDAVARAKEIFVERFEHEIGGAWAGTPVPADDGAADARAE